MLQLQHTSPTTSAIINLFDVTDFQIGKDFYYV